MTTILAYLVGRSVVSAMTQTPASGPLAPVTLPPMSLSPTCIEGDRLAAISAAEAAMAVNVRSLAFIGAPGCWYLAAGI